MRFRRHGYCAIGCDGCIYLNHHGIGRCAVEMHDAKMLFYPFEKHLNLPPFFVEHGDGFGREFKVVGQELECLILPFRVVCHHTQRVRVSQARPTACEPYRLVGQHFLPVAFPPFHFLVEDIPFPSHDEKCPATVYFTFSPAVFM